jgi:hypothetical protein
MGATAVALAKSGKSIDNKSALTVDAKDNLAP